jgi:lipid A disaccharide synthetase
MFMTGITVSYSLLPYIGKILLVAGTVLEGMDDKKFEILITINSSAFSLPVDAMIRQTLNR